VDAAPVHRRRARAPRAARRGHRQGRAHRRLEGRTKATGQGVAYCIEEWFQDRESRCKGAASSCRASATWALRPRRSSVGMGALCVAVQDADGTIFDPNGIDVGAADDAHVYENKENLKRSVAGFPGGQALGRDDFWDGGVRDLRARRRSVTRSTAPSPSASSCKLVAEGANRPTTPRPTRARGARHRRHPGHHRQRRRRDRVVLRVDPEQAHGALDRGRGEHQARARDQARTTASSATSRRTAGRKTAEYDSRPFVVGREVPVRVAAMVLALRSGSRRTTCSRASRSSGGERPSALWVEA
jgi:glutamate dehydrogenase (NAD(P)+)